VSADAVHTRGCSQYTETHIRRAIQRESCVVRLVTWTWAEVAALVALFSVHPGPGGLCVAIDRADSKSVSQPLSTNVEIDLDRGGHIDRSAIQATRCEAPLARGSNGLTVESIGIE
jgi:glycine cleavage system regulatory protein